MDNINYNMNFFDVMRQIIKKAKNGKYETNGSTHLEGKDYWITMTFEIEEMKFENERLLVPMEEL